MSYEDARFGLADDATPDPVPAPVQAWQIDQIRNALDVTGSDEVRR